MKNKNGITVLESIQQYDPDILDAEENKSLSLLTSGRDKVNMGGNPFTLFGDTTKASKNEHKIR